MSVTASLSTHLAHVGLPVAQLHLKSPIDTTCNVSEVRRLLWSAITVAAVTGGYSVARPNWRRVAGLFASAILWLWIDMEGPVLIDFGGRHGLHLADVPVVIAVIASASAALHLLIRDRDLPRLAGPR